jgi:peptide/nickel transport system substrate-binding protein
VRRRRLGFLCLAALGLLPGPASAAARARVGGTLSVGLLGLPVPGPDVGAETPEAASARALLALPLCRLLPEATPVLAAVSRVGASSDEVQVTPLQGARFPDGTPLRPGDMALTLSRALVSHGPAATLLAPLASPEAALEEAVRHPEAPLRLRLAYPWPDFEASLCHPAFTPSRLADGGAGPGVGVGLYVRGPDGRLLGGLGVPAGAPFPSALAFASVSARGAARALQRGEVQALLGASSEEEAEGLLFATYLLYRPGSLSAGALGVLSSLDLQALVRTFVPGPAVAMPGLLPPGLLGTGPGPAAPRGTAGPPGVSHGFSLGYEAALPEQRAVAERLQVLLHDAGYALRLVPETRAGLLRARTGEDFDAQLVSVLLPPLPAPALAVVLGLVGDGALLHRELPPLGALTDASARAARVRARARELQPGLPLVPLFARGLRVQLAEGLLGARRDGFGLLVLDEASLVR